MKTLLTSSVVALSLVALTGCQTKAQTGTLIGAGTGAVIGNRLFGGGPLGTVGGAAVGGILGNALGSSMDQQDRIEARQRAMEARMNQRSSWRGKGGQYYSVQPTHQFHNRKGEVCREYTTTVTVGGKQQKAYGTACRRNPGDTWKIQK